MRKTKVGAFIPLPVVPTVIVGVNIAGKPNYLTVGFVSGVNIKPPIIGISLNRKHHSVKGLLENGTFSINVPTSSNLLETDYCGLVSGRSVDKSLLFTSFYGDLKTAPMIEEFPIVCECKFTGQKVDFTMDTIYFGEIIEAYVDSSLYKKGQPADIQKINPLLTGLDRQYRLVGESIGKAFSIGWDYVSKTQQNSTTDNLSEIELSNRPPRYSLYINCDIQNQVVQQSIQDIEQYIKSIGVEPLEGPFVIRSEGLEPEADVKVGFTFKSQVKGKGTIKSGKISGGRFFKGKYTGPYSKMSSSLSSLHEHIIRNGFQSSGFVYEFYLNDPSKVSSDKLETVLLIPVKKL
jgi:flavin reductase (DIM6/NTAB) family NADH-FMN oxidoreductase RutF/effector-binding domain-containing protein